MFTQYGNKSRSVKLKKIYKIIRISLSFFFYVERLDNFTITLKKYPTDENGHICASRKNNPIKKGEHIYSYECLTCLPDARGSFLEMTQPIGHTLAICDIKAYGQVQSERGFYFFLFSC